MKRLYDRTTTPVSVTALPPAVAEAIRDHAEQHALADPLPAATRVVVTHSEPAEPPRRRWFGGRAGRRPDDTYLLLTPDRLVLATDAGDNVVVSSYRLAAIELEPFSSPLVADTGVSVLGTATGATEPGSRFVPLDEGPHGIGFRDALRDAIG